MESWHKERVEASIQFLLDHRPDGTEMIDIEVANDLSNKSIVLKVSNNILVESARSPNFVAIIYVEQCKRDNLLRELLDEIQPQNYSKVFFVDELVANPIGNVLVPKQERCTKKVVKRLLREYSLTVDALPRMLLQDPIARWYGWKVGDVIEVTRSNGERYHRVVV